VQASPDFVDEMARVAQAAPREAPGHDDTVETDIEIVSRDPSGDDEEAWEVIDGTQQADPAMVERLRNQLRRK